MNKTIVVVYAGILMLLFVSCKNNSENNSTQEATASNVSDSTENYSLPESKRLQDTIDYEPVQDELKPVASNFFRINSISNWTNVITKEEEESSEGGEVRYYYNRKVLEKITVRQFGENFQRLTEYYLLNEELSFVYEKMLHYNRPIYYDSAAMKENGDDQVFDINRSTYSERKSYLLNKKLVYESCTEGCEPPYFEDYLIAEQAAIMKVYNSLKEKLVK